MTSQPNSDSKEISDNVSSELLLVGFAGFLMFIGLHAPEFRLPGKEWIGTVIQIFFFACSAVVLTAAVVLWRRKDKVSEDKSAD